VKILLLNPMYKKGYIHSARWDGLTISGSNWYPIFLSYCTGLLEKNGFECKLIDAEADDLTDYDLYKIAKDFKPDFTVIYVSEEGLEFNIKLTEKIKALKSKIIFVGPWCSIPTVQKKSRKIADYIINGEFEFAVLDIINGKRKGKLINSGRLTNEQLKKLPRVTQVYSKHLNLKNYKIGSLHHPFVDLFSGRKCYWGKCIFCLWPHTILKEGGYVSRDIEDVLDEIEWAVNNLQIKEIFIQDDSPPFWRCKQIAEGLLKRGIKIQWSTYARGDLTLTPEILKLMRKSGCHCLHVGYESGSDKILKNINKGLTKSDLETFTKWCNEAGVDVHADFMIGLPGETEDTIKETIEWAKRLNVLTYQFSTPKVYPCTPYYDYTKSNGHPMSLEDTEKWSKRAMKECYFSFNFFIRILNRPYEIFRLFRHGKYLISYLFKNVNE
jgi:radical SAM superfamily enzyme YgiQ (UPF0313 family)